MLQKFLGWLSEFEGNVSFLIVSVPQTETSFDWSTVISTLVGALVTLAASILAFWLSNRSERKKREEEQLKINASNALSGYFKLAGWANLIANINLQIDKSYEASRSEGLEANEPFASVGPPAGRFTEPDTFKPAEYSFLLSKEHSGLINDVLLVEQRAINLHHLLEKYSVMHIAFQEWQDEQPGLERELDGPIATDKIPGEYKSRYDMRAANLNRILEGIIGQLEEDIKFSIATTQEFVKIAHEKFSPYFPMIDFRPS